MVLFNCLEWPEMRPVALRLIAHMHEGHDAARAAAAVAAASGEDAGDGGGARFSIAVVDFLRVFSPGASPSELAKVAERGQLEFTSDSASGGTFALAAGERALFDLHREGLVLRIPTRMSGRYELRPGAFTIFFNRGGELEGCKRLLLLVCNRVVSVDVSGERVDVSLTSKLFDLCVEFQRP